jgi:hypothetical protein
MKYKYLAALSLVLYGTSLFASSIPKETIESEKERIIPVEVPQTQINVHPPEAEPARLPDYEFAVSSWVPGNFKRGSYTGDESTFQKGGAPAFTVNRIREIVNLGRGVRLSSLFGLSYLQMARTKMQKIGQYGAGSATEDMNLFMGRAGVQCSWSNLLPWGFEPNMSFALLPTWAMADQSAYENSVGEFGTPLEASVGLLWRTGLRASLLRGDMSVGVAWQAVAGAVGGSSMKGSGWEGAFRISL